MHEDAYRQYADEADSALKRQRTRLVEALIERFRPKPGPLAVLEVGAGVGQNLAALARFGVVDALEVNPGAIRRLERLRLAGTLRHIITEPLPSASCPGPYDVICALDVLEHIADDRAALAWMAGQLTPRGLCVLTVPAYAWLFSDHDRALAHHRRYSERALRRALPPALPVVAVGYFNTLLFPAAVAARAAWQAMRRVRRAVPGAKQPAPRGRLGDALVDAALRAEVELARRGLRAPFGMTLYCVARRRESA